MIKGSQKLPSLARVAVVFFAAILLMGFLDDNGHRVLANMKGYAHRPSPPFGDVEQPPSLLCSSSHPLWDKAIVLDKQNAVKDKKNAFRCCALVCKGGMARFGETWVRVGGRHTENAKKDFQSDLRFGNMRVESGELRVERRGRAPQGGAELRVERRELRDGGRAAAGPLQRRD